MRVKQIFSMLLCIAFVAAILSSCSGKNTKASGSGANEPSNTTSDTQNTSEQGSSQSSADNSTAGSISAVNTATGTNGTTTSNGTTKTTTTTTKAKTTTTTKAKTTTTTKAKTTSTTISPDGYSIKSVSPSSVKTISGAKVQRAWKASFNGVTAEIHKIAYGSKITQAFNKKNDSAITYEKTVTYQPVCNVAVITCGGSRLNLKTSKSLLGTTTGLVEDMAKKAGAIIAVNGTAGSSYASDVTYIINGAKVNSGASSVTRLLLHKDGLWTLENISNSNASSLINSGVRNSIRYQDILVRHGEVTTKGDSYYHNRTVIAQISACKYIIAVGEFMPLASMAKILKGYGAKTAVLVNGGNCSSMYVRGIGNVTGTKATQLKNQNKVNVVESEFFGSHGLLGLNSSGKQMLGGPCKELDIIYVK